MGLKAQLEAIIYAAETPISLEQMAQLVKESVVAEGAGDEAEVKSRIRAALEDLVADYGGQDHGIEIRQLAGGNFMSTQPQQPKTVARLPENPKTPLPPFPPPLNTPPRSP